MKINKDHFIETDKYISQQVKGIYSSFVNPYNYGILSQQSGNNNPLNIHIDIDNQNHVHVKVINCVGITPGGIKIDIQDNYFAEKDLSGSLPALSIAPEEMDKKEYFIALAVNPFKRIPFGTPDIEESQPRLPHVLPEYRLSVHQTDEKDTIIAARHPDSAPVRCRRAGLPCSARDSGDTTAPFARPRRRLSQVPDQTRAGWPKRTPKNARFSAHPVSL